MPKGGGTALIVLLCGMLLPVYAASIDVEYQLKANYLYRFGKFTRWPYLDHDQKTAHDRHELFHICVLDLSLFQAALPAVVGQFVGSREVVFQEISTPEELKPCEIVFIDQAHERFWQDALMPFNEFALTVGESLDFLKNGGIIQFYIESDKLRFAIHLDNLKTSPLTIQGRLLGLAKRVKQEDL